MGRKSARNMQIRNTNKIGIQCICWFYSQGSFINILYFKTYISNLIFYSCKLVLMSFVMYPLKNNSPTKATIGGRNIQKVYDIYIVINSLIFLCICWFYSHNLVDLFGTRLIVSSKSFKSSSSTWSVIQHYFWVLIFSILVTRPSQCGLFLLSFSSTGSSSNFFKISSFLLWSKRVCTQLLF